GAVWAPEPGDTLVPQTPAPPVGGVPARRVREHRLRLPRLPAWRLLPRLSVDGLPGLRRLSLWPRLRVLAVRGLSRLVWPALLPRGLLRLSGVPSADRGAPAPGPGARPPTQRPRPRALARPRADPPGADPDGRASSAFHGATPRCAPAGVHAAAARQPRQQ